MASLFPGFLKSFYNWRTYFIWRVERCTRRQWWFLVILSALAQELHMHAFVDFYLQDFTNPHAITHFILFAVFSYCSLVVDYKRCLDINNTIFFILPVTITGLHVSSILYGAYYGKSLHGVMKEILPTNPVPFAAFALIFIIAYVVVFGFFSGAKGDNRYGPDPRQRNRSGPPDDGQLAEV